MHNLSFRSDQDRPSDDGLSFDQLTFEEMSEQAIPDSGFEASYTRELSPRDPFDSLPDVPILDEQDREEVVSFDVQEETVSRETFTISENKKNIAPQSAEQLVQSRLVLIRQALTDIRDRVDKALALIQAEFPTRETSEQLVQVFETKTSTKTSIVIQQGVKGAERILEGVFDGQHMSASDSNQYAIPQNYASKSKLVEGDALKLTITDQGSFIYKQVGPTERIRIVGILQADESHNAYSVRADNRQWNVLTASVTYFHGAPGDEMVILVPRDRASSWAAVENVIKR